MKNLKVSQVFFLAFLLVGLIGCSKDYDTFARVTVNGTRLQISPSDFSVGDRSDFNGDIDASFTGNGGTTERVFSWNNNLNTADYNADVTLGSEGSFQMIVSDSDGTIVLDQTIQGGAEPHTIGGVTASGTSGIWTVTIRVRNFDGDGSFSLSEGD